MRSKDAIAVAATLALYRGTILPAAQRNLDHWRRVAAAMPDPELRGVALAALSEKAANPEATALFAALAPRPHRRAALVASTALQVAIDYLDSLGERPAADPLGEGLRLHGALAAALSQSEADSAAAVSDPYLAALIATCRRAAGALPAAEAVLPFARRAAKRCGEGQSHTHAAAASGPAHPVGTTEAVDPGRGADDLEAWARTLGAPAEYRWWEVAAGACSSVGAHALIALAADPAADASAAEAVDAAYFPAVGALTVILDDLVDRAADAVAGEHSYLSYYADATDAKQRLVAIVADGATAMPTLPRPDRQTAILAGVVAYYAAALAGTGAGGGPRGACANSDRAIAVRLLAAAPPAAVPLAAILRRAKP